MARHPVQVRDAVPEDAAALISVWNDLTRGRPSRLATPDADEAARAVARVALDPDHRLVVGIVDDVLAGMASLRRAALTPIHDEQAVLVDHLYVHSEHRRRGVGRALIAAAATWADEKQSGHLMASVAASSRDANRFLARLGLPQVATVRAAPVDELVRRLAAEQPPEGVGGKLVAARRRTLRRRPPAQGTPKLPVAKSTSPGE